MGGINGIGGVPEPRSDRPANVRDRRDTPPPAQDTSSDGVVISSEAQAAAAVTRIIDAASTQPDIREDRVEEARAAIERGDHKNPEIVQTIAERITKIL